MVSRTLRWEIAAYVVLFSVAFACFGLLRIPSRKLARIATAHAATAGWHIEYDDVEATLLPGFKLVGVRVFDESAEPKGAPIMELQRLGVRAVLLPLFVGKPGAVITAEGYGGRARARVLTRGQTTWLDAQAEGISLGEMPSLEAKLNTKLTGSIDARAQVELYPALTQHSGTIEIALNDVRVAEGMLLGSFKIPAIDLGDVHGSIIIENGKAIFDRFAGDGQDLKLTLEGEIALSQPIALSTLNVTAKIKPSQRLEQALGFSFPLLGLNKSPQGDYVRRFGGTLLAPR